MNVTASSLASVHAAVIAINEAIDQGVPEGTLAALQNPNAMLIQLDPSSAGQYHDTLYRAKGEKVASSRKRVREGSVTDPAPLRVHESGHSGRTCILGAEAWSCM